MKTHLHSAWRAFAAAIALTACSVSAATISASSTPPVINDADIANLSPATDTEKWFAENSSAGAAKGQTFTTNGAAVRLKSITYRNAAGNKAEPTKTYAIRLGKATGTAFTPVHSETATQTFTWNAGQYITWTFSTPVLLEPYTTYGIDVGMTNSTSSWQTGIPYIEITADEFPGGGRYNSGTSGAGTSTLSYAIGSDRVFHLDIERPLDPVFQIAATSPLDNAADALANRNVVLTFSQNVTPGSGNLTIRNLSDGTETSLAPNDSRLTYDQNVVRINPTGLLTWNKNYAIRIDAGTFLGDGGAPIAPISDDTTWNFSTSAADPLLAALAAIKAHVLNTTPLTGAQISAHKTTIDNNSQRFAENTEIITAVFDLITTYDTAKGPLFVGGFANNATSFDRNVTTGTAKNSISPENFHWVIYNVMQYAMDVIYTPENLAQYEALLAPYKYGSHTSFPGPCSPPSNPANTHTVQINGSFPATFGRLTQMWTAPARKPTGTYLAPGTIATVTVPPALVNAGYKIRVGAHSWDLSHRRPVNRLERASRLYSITSTTTKVASPYGGGIYIEVPYLANAGVVSVTVTGGVRSAYFSAKSFHQTTATEWTTERTHVAPWADFQSDKFMVQVPRKWIFNMTGAQATQLMVDWDKAMDTINDLMGFPRNRGKETMYCQTDVILRSAVHAPGYPAVNVTSNVNSDVSPLGYAGNYLVRGPATNATAANIEFHEQGHAYGFPKFGGESESNVNLLQPAMLIRAFGVNPDVAHAGSLGASSAARTMDNTAIAWMCVFNFSPREVPMASGESAYQHKGHAKWMDTARLFGWDKLDTFWRTYMEDEVNNLTVNESTDSLLLRLCRAVGADIRPLFHFWGIYPQNPSTLAAAIAAENIQPSNAIRLELLRYKTLVPANNAAFRTFAQAWWGKQPSIGGAWEEREHSRQWDTTPLYGPGDQQRSEATNPGEIYNENSANDIRNRVDELVELYFPGGITPSTMTFAVAPAVVNSTTAGMIATTATAGIGPVEYLFEETSGNPGGNSSTWQTSPTYQDSGLSTGTTYSYRVKARDGTLAETNFSAVIQVTPTASGDITPPTPSPMTFSTAPSTVDVETITMTASIASDVNGVEYLFENITTGTNSGWQDSPLFTETGLPPSSEFTYRVRARDKSANQNLTAFSAPASANTGNPPDLLPPSAIAYSPADSSLVSNLATNLVITFDEPILVGSGTITLKNLTDGTEAQFAVGNPAVTIAGSALTLNPPADLLFGKTYSVRLSAGIITDVSNNPFLGIDNDTTWNFEAILGDPIANAGGPYRISPSDSLSLNGSASLPSHLQTITSWEWDLNNDGNFSDASGQNPSAITEANLRALHNMVDGPNTIQLRVTDSAAKTAVAQGTVNLFKRTTFTGASGSGGATDNWNVAARWDFGVPADFTDAVIPDNKYVVVNPTTPTTTPAYSGNLSIGSNSTLQIGWTSTVATAFNSLGSGNLTMASGSLIKNRNAGAIGINSLVLNGNATISMGESTQSTATLTLGAVTGSGAQLTLLANSNGTPTQTLNANNPGISTLRLQHQGGAGNNASTYRATAAGAFGTGNVIVEGLDPANSKAPQIRFSISGAMASSGSLFLNGLGPAGDGLNRLIMDNGVTQTISALYLNGVRQPAGSYTQAGLGSSFMGAGTGTLIVAGPADAYWDIDGTTAGAGGATPSGTWDDTTANWSTNSAGNIATAAWTAGQNARFSAAGATGSYNVTVSGTQDIGGLSIDLGNANLSGGGLRLVAEAPVSVASGSTATLASVLSQDSTARGISKIGAGTLVLSGGGNTYAGPTALGGGTLSVSTLANAGAASDIGQFPTSGAAGLVLSGGTFRYTGGNISTNRGFTVLSSTTMDVNTAGTALSMGNFALSGTQTLTVNGGSGSSLALGNFTANGTANINANIPVTTGALTLSANSTVTHNGTAPLAIPSVSGAFNLTITGSGNGVTSGVLGTGGGTLTKSGSGTWTLQGANTYTGTTTVSQGNLIAATDSLSNTNGAFGRATSDITLGAGGSNNAAGILTGGPHTIGRIIRNATNNTTDSGTRILTLGGNTAHNSAFTGNIFLGTNNQTSKGVTLTAATDGQVTFSGVIQNPGGQDTTEAASATALVAVTKTGAGKVVLSNNNTYTGGTLISAGTLEITGANQSTNAITFTGNSSLGLVIGTPVTAASAAVNLANGRISVTGTPSGPSHVLLTALSITGTPVLTAPIPGYELQVSASGNQLLLNQVVTDPYVLWSGGAAFNADANGDGVNNGLAWILGAANPNANAASLLPVANRNSGFLRLTFRCLKSTKRGTAQLKVQSSVDLGASDPWTSREVPVPDADGTVNGVVFDTTDDGDYINVIADIPAAGSRQFARLQATP